MTTDNHTEKRPTPAKFSLAEKITIALGLVTLVGVVLAQMGLGVALSAESQFGIPHTTLISSPFEFIQLAPWAVINLFSGLNEFLAHPAKYLTTTNGSLWVVVQATLFLAVIITIAKGVGLARWRAIRRKKIFAWIFLKPSLRDSYSIWWARIGLLGAIAALISFVVPIFLLIVIFVFCFGMVLVPVLSIAAGDAHIHKYVVGPENCFPVRSREVLMQDWERKKLKSADSTEKSKPAAICVSILDGEKVLFSGRVVWATSQSILLFDPGTGEVRRMSINGRDVKPVGSLPVEPVKNSEVSKASGKLPNTPAEPSVMPQEH